MQEMLERRKQDLNLRHLITVEGSQIRTYALMNTETEEYRKNKQSATIALKNIDDSRCDRQGYPIVMSTLMNLKNGPYIHF
jgi:hypothetical protein